MTEKREGRQSASVFAVSLLAFAVVLFTASCYRPIRDYKPWVVLQTVPNNQPKPQITQPAIALVTKNPTLQVTATATPTSTPQPTVTPVPGRVSPTPNPPIPQPTLRAEWLDYKVEQGDSLGKIAQANQVSVQQILKYNTLKDPNLLTPGQMLSLPPATSNDVGPATKIIPDSELIYSPSALNFDTAYEIARFNGKLASHKELLEDGRTLTGTEIVQEVADINSVNPRLLLTLIEFRSGWLTQKDGSPSLKPSSIGWSRTDQSGLYKQLNWAANEMLRGYVLWQYHALALWNLGDGNMIRIDPTINPGTAGVQYILGLLLNKDEWMFSVSESGFTALYERLWGYPFDFTFEPLIPDDISQPVFELPFAQGDTWYMTSGPHWGWGTGSPWAALDFAPPPPNEEDYGCFDSNVPILSVAAGEIVRSNNGSVVLDLDGDGSELTGWSVLFMHVAELNRVAKGTKVEVGDVIGYPSCEGGITQGTHLHLARKYNGVWIRAGGMIPFNLGGWAAQEAYYVYDGYLNKDGQTVEAYNGRADFNKIGR